MSQPEMLDASYRFALRCLKASATPYIITNGSREIISVPLFKQARDHSLLLATLNGVSEKELQDFLAQRRETNIDQLQRQGILACN